ncbi:MAG: alpha-amylase family glycosyl hydrolase [Rickettsiales bacterium]
MHSPSIDTSGQASDIAYFAYLPSLKYKASDGWKPHWVNKDGKKIHVPEGITGTFEGLDEGFFKNLKSLGVTRMWLSPPLDCPMDESGIGYNTKNYHAVSPLFGTEKHFRDLIARAEQHGIKVVMDLVLNHGSVQSADFQKSRNPANPEHRLFTWQDPILVGKREAKNHPELKDAFAPLKTPDDYEALRKKVQEQGINAVPHITVPLRDETGQIMKKRDPKDGHETDEILTIPLYGIPETDWSHGVLYTDNKTIWLPFPKTDQDGNIMYPPNNSISLVTQNTAWVPDEKTGQVYKAFFAQNQPDWAIGNKEANAKLIDAGKHWVNAGLDGFRLDAFRMAGAHPLLRVDGEEQEKRLAELLPEMAGASKIEHQLAVAGITSNPPNTLRGLFPGWENPSPTQAMLDELRQRYPEATRGMDNDQVFKFASQLNVEIPKQASDTGTLFPPGWREWIHRDVGLGLPFWQQFSQEMNKAAGKPVFLQGEFGDDNDLGKKYLDAKAADCLYLSTYDQAKNIQDVRTATEAMLATYPQGKGVELEPTNHDTPRGFKNLTGNIPPEDALKFRTLMWKFMSRVPCSQLTLYTGEELALPNPDGKHVRTPFEERDMGGTRGYIHNESNDCNTGRAAYPYDKKDFDAENLLCGQGHTYRTPPEWDGLTYQEQDKNPTSPLNAIRTAMQVRASDPVLSKTGNLSFLNSETPDVLVYTRSNAESGKAYLFIDNFTSKPVEVDLKNYAGNPIIDALIAERQKAAAGLGNAAKITVDAFGSFDPAAALQKLQPAALKKSRG